MRNYLMLVAVVMISCVCVQTIQAIGDASDSGIERVQRDMEFALDLASERFTRIADRFRDDIWVLARIEPGTVRERTTEVEEDTLSDKYEYRFLAADTLKVLHGEFPYKSRLYRFDAYAPNYVPHPIRHPEELIPRSLRRSDGIALFHVIEPMGLGKRSGIKEAFCIPDVWSDQMTSFFAAAENRQEIPFVPVDPKHVDEWERVVDGPNRLLGIIALARLLEAERDHAIKMHHTHIASAQGTLQAIYTMLTLKIPGSKQSGNVYYDLRAAIQQAKSFDDVRGIALALILADGHTAEKVATEVRVGLVTRDALDSIPVADRICEPLLTPLLQRFRYMNLQNPYFLALQELSTRIAKKE